ncbi:MAG: helix-turn-helix domain-containing protein [Chthoniobacteraceae bacterium]
MSTKHKNIVGPQVRKRRYSLGLKQADLAARLQILGWEIDRAGVSKIESQFIWVSDFEMLYLSEALKIAVTELLPNLNPAKRLNENITALRTKRAAFSKGTPPIGKGSLLRMGACATADGTMSHPT